MIDIGAGDDAAEADHARDRGVAMLADPLTDHRRVPARRAGHVVRIAIRIRRRTPLAAHRAPVEGVARLIDGYPYGWASIQTLASLNTVPSR